MVNPSFLYTERLTLRPLTYNDKHEVFFLRADKDLNKYIKREPIKTIEEAVLFIERIEREVKTELCFNWCISISSTENLPMIGNICFWNFSDDRKTAEVGYTLHPDFQGMGIMDEALKKVIQVGFEHLKLNSIEAYTSRFNQPSINLLKKNKFKLLPERIDNDDLANLIFELTARVSD